MLFGLGFDTATEVALLFLAAGAAGAGLPFYAILCLPILFAAGMSLLDTIDGSFMNFAYGWAFSKPVRKVYYNITITGLSVAVALVIGTIELVGLLAQEAERAGIVLGVGGEHRHQHARLRHRRRCSSPPGWSRWRSGGSAGSRSGGAPAAWRGPTNDRCSGRSAAGVRRPGRRQSAPCAGEGLRLSTPRRLVLEALFAADGPLSGRADRRPLRASTRPRRIATSRRSNATGSSATSTSATGRAVPARRAGEREYLFCEHCREVRALDPEQLEPVREQIGELFGYEARFTHFAIVGLCASCAAGPGADRR